NCDRNDSVSIKVPSYLMNNSVWKNLHYNLGSYWMSIGIVFLPTGILCGNIYILHLLILEIIFIIVVPLIITFYYIRKYLKN
ncbi:MAG: SdpI family protein, partial [Intestinibacter sp.]